MVDAVLGFWGVARGENKRGEHGGRKKEAPLKHNLGFCDLIKKYLSSTNFSVLGAPSRSLWSEHPSRGGPGCGGAAGACGVAAKASDCVCLQSRDSASSDASWHPGARPLHAIPVPHTALVPTLACRRPCCAPHLVQSPLFLDVARHLPN